jgi:hypothetical protein
MVKVKKRKPRFEGRSHTGGCSMWLRMRQIALIARELAPVVEEIREVFGRWPW